MPQAISNFYACRAARSFLEDGKTVPRIRRPPSEIPSQLKARYIVFIDNLNIQPQNRNRMFKRLKEFLTANVGPQAEAMVVTYNRSLKIKQKFTSEKGDVLSAVEQTEMETGGGTTLAGERRDALQRINDSKSETEAIQVARSHAQSLRNDLQFAVDSFKTTLNGLAGVEGRKVFIYVSEGLPASAGAELFETIRQKYPGGSSSLESLEFDMNSRYATIAQAANSNGVTIFALDASGLAGDEMVSAENRYMENRPSSFLMRQNTQAPLQMLAEQTGGLAAVNTNDWKDSLGRAVQGLLELLLASVTARHARRPTARTPSRCGRSEGTARPGAQGPPGEVDRNAHRRGGRGEPLLSAERQSARRESDRRRSEAIRPGQLPAPGPRRGAGR